MENMKDNYYEFIGVERDAEEEVIRRACNQLLLKYHPDICREDFADGIAKHINKIKSTLCNSEKREEYDNTLTAETGKTREKKKTERNNKEPNFENTSTAETGKNQKNKKKRKNDKEPDLDNISPKGYGGDRPRHLKKLAIGVVLCLLIIGANAVIKNVDTSTVSEHPTPTPPVANFSADTKLGNAPLTVEFTDMSTNATEWSWNLGDGFVTKAQNPEHIYTKAGTYTVELTASNEKYKNTMRKTNYITVEPPSPALIANFSASTTSGKAPLKVKFTDESSGSPTKWEWNFGDGTSSTEKNPVHEYRKAGKYTVKETVFRQNINNEIESKRERKINYIIVTSTS